MKLTIALGITMAIMASFCVEEASAGAEALIMTMVPPECKKEIEKMKAKGKGIHEWIVKTECPKCSGGVPAKNVVKYEGFFKNAFGVYLDWLAANNFDINKVCPKYINKNKIFNTWWPEFKKDCIMTPNEVPVHPNLCVAKKEDFPKTMKCFNDKAEKILNDVMKDGPPMNCVSYGLARCNAKNMGAYTKHFMTDMKAKAEVHKGANAWFKVMAFFDSKCTKA